MRGVAPFFGQCEFRESLAWALSVVVGWHSMNDAISSFFLCSLASSRFFFGSPWDWGALCGGAQVVLGKTLNCRRDWLVGGGSHKAVLSQRHTKAPQTRKRSAGLSRWLSVPTGALGRRPLRAPAHTNENETLAREKNECSLCILSLSVMCHV